MSQGHGMEMFAVETLLEFSGNQPASARSGSSETPGGPGFPASLSLHAARLLCAPAPRLPLFGPQPPPPFQPPTLPGGTR